MSVNIEISIFERVKNKEINSIWYDLKWNYDLKVIRNIGGPKQRIEQLGR